MKKKSTTKKLGSDFERLSAMTDDEIDIRDIPEVAPEQFARAIVRRGFEPFPSNAQLDMKNSRESEALVFISHDCRDADLANSFGELIRVATAGLLDSFSSSDKSGEHGLLYGSEWYPEMTRRIEQASALVCLLTPRSYERPWILYEAGYAKGKLGIPVHGLVLGMPISQVIGNGPFGQFHNTIGEPEAVVGLVMQLARHVPRCNPAKHVVESEVNNFLASVKALEAPPADPSIPHTLHHVSLPVQDLAKSIDFYLNVLELEEAYRPDLGYSVKGFWFKLPSGQQLHLLENPAGTFRDDDEPDYNDCHFALRVPDVAAAYKRLQSKNQKLVNNPDIQYYRYPHFYLVDPDNHVIEFNQEPVSYNADPSERRD